MTSRTIERLLDIKWAISEIEILLEGKTFSDLTSDNARRAAFERFLEIVSEASRHVPSSMQDMTPTIDWSRIRGLGNILRHAYNRVDPQILWSFYENGQLADLKDAVMTLITSAERGSSTM